MTGLLVTCGVTLAWSLPLLLWRIGRRSLALATLAAVGVGILLSTQLVEGAASRGPEYATGMVLALVGHGVAATRRPARHDQALGR